MAQKPYPKSGRTTDDPSGDILFQVVIEQVIGDVRRGSGNLTPVEAAFLLIGRHQNGAPGVYSFPHEQGGMVRVEVECQPPPGVDPEMWTDAHIGHNH